MNKEQGQPVAEPVTGELSLEVVSELVEFYREAETQWSWRETVRMLAVFQPDVGVVRQVAERAYDLANENRISGNPGEQASYMGAGDALTILADRVEQQRK